MKEKGVLAIYLRLSDEDKNVSESNSITGQRQLIRDYINRNNDLLQYNTIEFCDDGYSGTNFLRPAVSDMLNQIKEGGIHCIIVKDFSRFGRNYIEVGNYIEEIFPFLGVRFVSINDGYDSGKESPCSEFIHVAFKNLVYDLYSKDLSEKIISVRRSKAEQGKFITGYAPYGYLKTDSKQLIVDKEAAEIVKYIFYMAHDGIAKTEIARILNREHIPTPLTLRKMRKQNFPCHHINEMCLWKPSVVAKILKDQRYMGDAVYGKGKPTSIGSGKGQSLCQKDWIIVPNTHEPIISREVFRQVNATGKHYKSRQKQEVSPLTGKVRCGACNYAISRRIQRKKNIISEFYYQCDIHNITDEYDCYHTKISESEIQKSVLKVLNQLSFIVADIEMKKLQQTDNQDAMFQLKETIKQQENQIKKYDIERLQVYETYKSGVLSKAEFMEYQKSYDTKVSAITISIQAEESKLYNIKRDMEDMLDEINQRKRWMIFDKLTKEVADTFIDTIYIQSDGSFKIKWKFNDLFLQKMKAGTIQ